jgi:hypothetical protein
MDISKIKTELSDKFSDLKKKMYKNTLFSSGKDEKDEDDDDEGDDNTQDDDDEGDDNTQDDDDEGDDGTEDDEDDDDEGDDEGDEAVSVDTDTNEFGKVFYSLSVSLISIIIIYLLTSNVLSLSYINKKSEKGIPTFISDVLKIIKSSSSLYPEIGKVNEISEYYKKLLLWYKTDNFYGKTIFKFLNIAFPPLILIIYILIFIILQIYTFFKGFVFAIENLFSLKIPEFFLTLFYLSALPVIYFLINKYLLSTTSNIGVVKVLFHIIVFPIFYILFSTVPFTGMSSFYIFSLIFFNSYNKLNKLYFIISKLKLLFFIYTLITFFSILLGQIHTQTIKISAGIGLGISLFILLIIVYANYRKVANTEDSISKILNHFTSIIEFETLT